MNTKQKIVLWVGISIIGILLAHPPYKLGAKRNTNYGHRNIITPIAGFTKEQLEIAATVWEQDKVALKIDVFRLLLECVLVGAITKGGIWAFKDMKDKTT